MKRFMGSVSLAAACLLPLAGTSVALHGAGLGSTVDQQLAQARAATAQYHDVDAAVADGYVELGVIPEEGETIEYVNFGLIDCTLDATHPEALRYVDSGQGLRLVAVEYSLPMACPNSPPEDFLPGAGAWEPEPGVPAWSMGVFLWSGNSADGSGSQS